MSTTRSRSVWGLPAAVATVLALCLTTMTPAVADTADSGGQPAASSAPAPAGTGIDRVTVGDTTVTVTGSVGTSKAGADVTVRESTAQASATATDASEFGHATADAGGRFTVTGPRTQADGTDGLYGEFWATVQGAAVGSEHFADALTLTSANTAAYPDVPDKKGLQVQMTDDSETLGVKHAAINVDLADIMLNKRTAPDNIVFVSGGKDYYFDQAKVAALDAQIKPLSQDGTLVNLILLVLRHKGDPNSAVSVLGDPDASSAAGSGPIVGFNTRTAEGVAWTTAAMEFIASRWSRPDHKYGQAVGYIVGNEVDAQWSWSNSGDKTISQFLDTYSRALRIASLATRKYYAAARTYTSLAHGWTVPSGPNPDPANPTRYYTSKGIVDGLNTISKATGDFPWFVAFHPYPQDLFNPAFWNDTEATDSIDSKFITFKNIQVLPRYLAQPDQEFQGQPRRIILSEQGCNTPGPGDDPTPAAQKLQAACFAYAYYKIRFLPSIDSFIWQRHVDNKGEGGLNLGLWSNDYSTKNGFAPLAHKYIYNVFRYIDTSRSLEVTDFAKKIIGIKDWKDVIPGFDPAALDQRPLTEDVGTHVDAKAYRPTSIGNFTADADGWTVSDNVSGAVATGGVLRATTAGGTFSLESRGVQKIFGSAGPAVSGRWLTAEVRIPTDAGLGYQTTARLTATLSNGKLVDGQGRVPADGRFHTVALQVPRQADANLDRLQVRVAGTGSGTTAATFDVQSVSTAALVGPSRSANVLASAVASSATLDGSTIAFSLTNLDSTPLFGVLQAPSPQCGDIQVKRLIPWLPSLPWLAFIPWTTYGQTATPNLTVQSVSGTGTTLCVVVNGTTVSVPVVVPPPTPNTLFGFESGTSGWVAGAGVDSVAQVTTFLNGPASAHSGTGVLEATTPPAPASTPRTISVTPATPIDLSKATSVYAWGDSYGGVPGATGYSATFTLTGTDGTTRSVTKSDFAPNKWNDLSIDVSSWAGRSSVASMSVEFNAVGSSYPTWNPRFQIDDVGYFTN